MAKNNLYKMHIAVDKNIWNLLPEIARNPELEEFYEEVNSHLRTVFENIHGLITTTTISKEFIEVEWKNKKPMSEPYEGLENLLKKGKLKEAILLLELFKSDDPENDVFLYNLGMAYSDLNELDEAVENLEKLLEIKPEHVNGRVAYGVALMRKGENEKALKELTRSVKQEKENPWAQRNLGACYLRLEKYDDAIPCLQRTIEIEPMDQRAWLGLGQAYEIKENFEEADSAYHKVIEIDEFNEIAEQAKHALSNLAEKIFRSKTSQTERMDGVMYCLHALETFEGMNLERVKQVGIEVALIGMNGIKVNNPEEKYTLKSLPGKYSGLHLLCLEYVAFQKFAPEQNIGFDLSKEYKLALQLFKKR